MDGVLGPGPGLTAVRDQLAVLETAAWEAADHRHLELSRLLVALLLHCDAELAPRSADSVPVVQQSELTELPKWPTSTAFTASERACLAFTEQFVTDVASLPDQLANDVRSFFGDEAFGNFVRALLVIEQRIRLRVTWDLLLGGTP